MAFITLRLPAYVMDSGLSSAQGAKAIALIGGLFNVLGSFAAGSLGKHYSKKHLLSIIYGMRAFGTLLLLYLPLTPVVLYVFAGWMGLFWLGTVPLTQSLIGQIYGLRYAGLRYAATSYSVLLFWASTGQFYRRLVGRLMLMSKPAPIHWSGG